MPKNNWDTAVEFVRKGHAAPVSETGGSLLESRLEPRKEDSKEERKESSFQDSNQETKIPRKRSWEMPGQDDWIKANFEVPRRIQTKLNQLKAWGIIKNIKDIVPDAIERALDQKIAKAEKEGY